MTSSHGAFAVLTLLLTLATAVVAQDSATIRHRLPVDSSHIQPFHRSYDILVQTRDSMVVVGQRDVTMSAATYAGAPSWLIVEWRTGVVPAAESLYLAPDVRPAHWSSAIGAARLGLEFVGDSIYGATTTPMGRQNVVLGARPDLLVSGAMAEALMPLLPLDSVWRDSVAVFAVDANSASIQPAELAVIGQEDLSVDSLTRRPSWVVALRSTSRQVLYWVDKETRATLRAEQAAAPHTGTLLEYRIRPDGTASPP